MSPVVNRVSSDMARGFSTGRPLADKPRVVRCTHCKRAVLEHRAKGHVEECIAKKQEKQRKKKEAKDARDAAARREREGSESAGEGDEIVLTGSKTARKTDGPDEEGASKSKKRRAEDADNGPSKKKKKKDEPKAKAPRPKAPVDVEKQCGVDLPQGGQCARSLTCKSHSMGSKRGVAGRSAPYDKLLAEYQRKNQAKLQSEWESFCLKTLRHTDSLIRGSTGITTIVARRRTCAYGTHRFGRRKGSRTRGDRSVTTTTSISSTSRAITEKIPVRTTQRDARQCPGRPRRQWPFRFSTCTGCLTARYYQGCYTVD